MGKNSIPPCWILGLTVAAVVLPIVICVVVGVGALLGAMGDDSGALALGRTALALGIVWAVDLICLVLAQAITTLHGRDEDE